MKQQPLVSIALCIYNGEKYLPAQLDSIFNQDYKNIEVIAVDDCSTDGSRFILEDYAKKHSNLSIHYNSSNLGYVKNFEKAILLSNGEYIALSDHDDIWHHQKISKQVAAIPGNLMVYHDSLYIDEEGNDLNISMSQILNLCDWHSPIPFFIKNCVSGHTILFHRSLIEHALPLDKNFFHDWWLAFVASNLGSIKYLPFTLVKYRQHQNNTIDMLNRKDDVVIEKKIPNPLLLYKEWIGHCSTYNGAYANYLAKIYHLIEPGISFFSQLKLFFLLIKNKDELMGISKDPVKRNFKAIKKMVFGLRHENN